MWVFFVLSFSALCALIIVVIIIWKLEAYLLTLLQDITPNRLLLNLFNEFLCLFLSSWRRISMYYKQTTAWNENSGKERFYNFYREAKSSASARVVRWKLNEKRFIPFCIIRIQRRRDNLHYFFFAKVLFKADKKMGMRLKPVCGSVGLVSNPGKSFLLLYQLEKLSG